MKIEKLNENKIRITLNLEDLKEKDIDLHTFMSNSIESQRIFLDMLEEAEKEVGFVTEDYRIMIEALALSDGSFVLTVTKMDTEMEKEKSKYKKVNIKRKVTNLKTKDAIYHFFSFESFCDFCNIFAGESSLTRKKLCKTCSLYLYHEDYYLILNDIHLSLPFSKSFFSQIIEYASPIHHTNLLKGKIEEYGKPIMKSNAINTCLKYFSIER